MASRGRRSARASSPGGRHSTGRSARASSLGGRRSIRRSAQAASSGGHCGTRRSARASSQGGHCGTRRSARVSSPGGHCNTHRSARASSPVGRQRGGGHPSGYQGRSVKAASSGNGTSFERGRSRSRGHHRAKRISKCMTKVLRDDLSLHDVHPDDQGYMSIESLSALPKFQRRGITSQEILSVGQTNRRFEIRDAKDAASSGEHYVRSRRGQSTDRIVHEDMSAQKNATATAEPTRQAAVPHNSEPATTPVESDSCTGAPPSLPTCSAPSCSGACGLYRCATCSQMAQTLSSLFGKQALTAVGSHRLVAFGVQSIQDVAFLAANTSEARDMGIPTEWEAARTEWTSDDRAAARLLVASETKATVPAAPSIPGLQSAQQTTAPHRPAAQPRPGAAPAPAQDLSKRQMAAEAAVTKSRTWRSTVDVDEQSALHHLQTFEARSVYTRLRAWDIWVAFCQQAGHNALLDGRPEVVATACQAQPGATGPQSLWLRLDFIRRHLWAPLTMPAKPGRAAVDGVVGAEMQGLVVEPEMLERMEMLLPQLQQSEDWRLGALLAASYIARAAVRFAHIQRSSLVQRDAACVHAVCFRGKSRRSRPAYKHACPRVASFTDSCIEPIDVLWDLWNRFRRLHGAKFCYLAFDARTGNALSMATFHSAIRELAEMAKATTSTGLITSKGFRMMQPTLADVRSADWGERLAIGNWSEGPTAKPQLSGRSVIPARYQGCRDASAAFTKAFQWAILGHAYQAHLTRHVDDLETPPFTWDCCRIHIQRMDFAEHLESIAEKLNTKEELAQDADPQIQARRFHIEPGNARTTAQSEAPDGCDPSTSPASDSDASESSLSNVSSVDAAVPWVHRQVPGAIVHIEIEGSPGVPWCHWRSMKPLASDSIRGIGIAALVSQDHQICRSCAKQAPDYVASLLSMASR